MKRILIFMAVLAMTIFSFWQIKKQDAQRCFDIRHEGAGEVYFMDRAGKLWHVCLAVNSKKVPSGAIIRCSNGNTIDIETSIVVTKCTWDLRREVLR